MLLAGFAERPETDYVVSSAHPRMVDGKRIQESALSAEAAGPGESARTLPGGNRARGWRAEFRRTRPVHLPVNAVLAGRRNNPADPKAGLPPLAVYNPIHYQELPELFMDFICSLTGKSPSTTGFGSEGALTKAAFNALSPVVDLNNALVSAILTGYAGFTTSAGYVGPNFRVDHDISLLVPEIWCRMRVHERDPEFLIANGYLEKVSRLLPGRPHGAGQPSGLPHHAAVRRPLPGPDFRDAGRRLPGGDAAAGEAGHRPVRGRRGRDRGSADARGAAVLRGRQRGGGLPAAEGAAAHHGRRLLSRERAWRIPRCGACSRASTCWQSDWYRERLRAKQARDIALWTRHLRALERFQAGGDVLRGVDLDGRLAEACRQLARVSAPEYLKELEGTIGADPYCGVTKTIN